MLFSETQRELSNKFLLCVAIIEGQNWRTLLVYFFPSLKCYVSDVYFEKNIYFIVGSGDE